MAFHKNHGRYSHNTEPDRVLGTGCSNHHGHLRRLGDGRGLSSPRSGEKSGTTRDPRLGNQSGRSSGCNGLALCPPKIAMACWGRPWKGRISAGALRHAQAGWLDAYSDGRLHGWTSLWQSRSAREQVSGNSPRLGEATMGVRQTSTASACGKTSDSSAMDRLPLEPGRTRTD